MNPASALIGRRLAPLSTVMFRCSRGAAVAALVVLAGCTRDPTPPDSQLVAQWLRTSLALVRNERLGPPVAARISAYGALALYEGYAADPSSRLRSLAPQLNDRDGQPFLPSRPDGPVDGAIVAAAAERAVLDSLFREGFASTRRTIDSLARAQIAARERAGVGRPVRDRSAKYGRALGEAILAYALTDGFFATRGRPWTPPLGRDRWANTVTTDQYVAQLLSAESDIVLSGNPASALDLERASQRWMFANRPKALGAATTLPLFNPIRPTEPYWGTLRTFALRDGDECALPPPPMYSEMAGSPFWKQAKEAYDSVRALTPEKREIALFWADNPVATGTPAFHWISVANQMISRRRLTADEAAELYALTSLAIADAFVACWKEKYRSLVVRPVAYIQRVIDAKFTTLVATPPFPEYPSGHSAQSAAAAEVLVAVLGDTIPFVDSTQVDIGFAPRRFRSFTHARDEVAISRVYAGIHYMPAAVNGVVQGECVGRRVLSRLKTRRSEQ
jgi:membrane-associated phospholipid phosphatase